MVQAVGAVGWQGTLNTTASGPSVFVNPEQSDTLTAYCYPFAVRENSQRSMNRRFKSVTCRFRSFPDVGRIVLSSDVSLQSDEHSFSNQHFFGGGTCMSVDDTSYEPEENQ